ncbi:MAG: DUF2341 domain-containing protein [Chitinispirillaceae bacterium]|nr:DUF2341 domain-containing protein [Chitinispirillaceae bacterium]
MNRILLGFILVSLMGCSTFDPLAGGSSQQGNGVVVGKVVNKYGTAAPNIVVKLYPMDYNPLRSAAIPGSCIDTTDSNGNYMLKAPRSSHVYQIYASNILKTVNALAPDITISGDTTHVADMVVSVPGTVKVAVPGNADSSNGYIYIPGTDIFVALNGNTEFALLTSVPEGVLSSIQYSAAGSIVSSVIRYDVSVIAADTVTVFNPAWKYARSIILNTTASGAAVAGNAYDFPVLIRLNSSNFDCTQAKNSGADIRFTKPDNTFLPYEIERWDSVSYQAEIWVKLDTIYGNDSTQSITMYWGNQNASDSSNGPAVFDTADGFQGVWHLSGAGNANAGDATIHHYNGTPTDTAPQTIPGIIGTALQFDGKSNGLLMKNTANGPLNFPRPGTYTFSAWVWVDSVFDEDAFIAGKGFDQYALRIKGSQSIPASMFALHEFVNAPVYGTDMRYAPVVKQQWKYMVGVRDTAGSYLFIDGRCVDSIGMLLNGGDNSADTTNFSIGRCGAAFKPNDYLPFQGKVDEVRIARGRFSADWIKLSYMNQKEQDALVTW